MMNYFFDLNLLNTKLNEKYKIIFDLDGTLIDELEYYIIFVRNYLAKYEAQSIYEITKIEEALVNGLRINGYSMIFQELKRNLYMSDIKLPTLMQELETVNNSEGLKPYEWVKDYIKLNHVSKIQIITNGNPNIQQNKVRLLSFNLDCEIDVFYAKLHGSKPKASVMQKFLTEYHDVDKIIYVGDNLLDLKFSRNVGCDFMRAKITNEKNINKSVQITKGW